jgi:hypothetical protein
LWELGVVQLSRLVADIGYMKSPSLLAGGLVLAACVLSLPLLPDHATAVTPGATATAVQPSLRIVTPKPNQHVAGKYTVRVQVSGFVLDKTKAGKTLEPGHGHLHFAMDGGRFDFPRYAGLHGIDAARSGTAGHFSPSYSNWITYSKLPRGRHTLRVGLVDNLHAPLPVTAAVTFIVR